MKNQLNCKNKRMVEYGDDLFTEVRLLMCDKVLDNYLNQLILLQETKHPESIMKAVEEIVITFNELNEKNTILLKRWNVKNWLNL